MSKKLIFFHDGPRWKNDKGVQFGNSSDIDIFKRYQYLASEVIFCMRVFLTSKTDKLTNLNNEGLYIKEIRPFNRPSKLFNYFKSKNKIKQQVESADIIIARLPSTIGSIAYWHAKNTKTPVLVEVVACPYDSLSNHSFLGKLYSKFSVTKLRKIMKDASFSSYVTENFLQKRYPTKGKSIAISDVVLKNFDSKNHKLEHYNNFDKGIINLGTLAVVDVKYKGHDLVLKAISILKQNNSAINYKYYIAGKGNSKRLKELANKLGVSDNVVFLGLIDHSEISKFFEKIDIYVQPSKTEGLPRAVIEAMSFGCACIGSSAGGIPELLDNSVIFKSDSVKSLIDKLKLFNNTEIFLKQSSLNYNQSKQYKFDFLENKRKDFYNDFLKSIK